MKMVHPGQKHQHSSHQLRGANLQLISAYVLLLFFSTICPSRGDICLVKSKNIKGTCYSDTWLENCLEICQSKEFQEPTEGKRMRVLYNDQFDHIQFVQIWTPTPCGPGGFMRCKNPLPAYYANNFSMHGLWPAAADGRTLLSTRMAKPVPAYVFERIEARMNIWWANINSKRPSHYFWEHEWCKHGATGNWGEDGAQDYFLDGIKSRQNIDLLSILEREGIKFNTDYRKQDIVGAIRKWLPVKNVYISCSRQQGGFYFLYEIFICLDKDTLSYISCPFDTNPRRCYGEFFQIPHT